MIPQVELLGLLAAALTTFAFLPQAARVWRRRSASDISLAMFVLFTIGVALWLIYGLWIGSIAVIAGNAVTLALSLSILVAKLKFG